MTNSSAESANPIRPRRVVIDNSALVNWLIYGAASTEWDDTTLEAPSLIDYEFAHVLRRAVHLGHVRESEGREVLEAFLELSITRHPARPILRGIWSHRHDLSAYDASYVALAQALGIPLLTADRRLARAAERWCDAAVCI